MSQEIGITDDMLELIQSIHRRADPHSPLWSIVDALKSRNKALQAELNIFHARAKEDYFAGLKTVVEIKVRYLQLVDEHNFYRGGDAIVVERINEQYTKACEYIILRTAISEDDMVKQCGHAERYIEVSELLFTFSSIKVEVEGASLVITCNEYQSEREFRSVGLKYIPDKGVWYYLL